MVCSIHFREKDFIPGGKYRRLKSDAAPSIFPGYPLYMQPKPKGSRCEASNKAALQKRHQNVEAVSKTPKNSRSTNIGKTKMVTDLKPKETVQVDLNLRLEKSSLSMGKDLQTLNFKKELELPCREKDPTPSFVSRALQTDNTFMLRLEKYKREFNNNRLKVKNMNRALEKQRAKLDAALSQLKSYSENNLQKILQRVIEDAKDDSKSSNRDRASFFLDQLSFL